MQEYEVNTIIENIPYLDRQKWEQTRFLVYSNVQMNTKKKLSPTDVMKFPWDNNEQTQSITNEDIERLKERSKKIYQSITNGE